MMTSFRPYDLLCVEGVTELSREWRLSLDITLNYQLWLTSGVILGGRFISNWQWNNKAEITFFMVST